MKKHSKSHAVIWGIVAILVVVMVYLMIDVGSASDVFRLYGSMSKDGSSNYPKSLVFLTSYTRTTGDLSLGNALGMSDDDIQNLLDSQDTTVEQGGGSAVSFTTNYTRAGWEDALKQRGNDSYYSLSAGYKIVTLNGSDYLVEVQGKTYYSLIKNGTDSSIDGNGCWMFAQVNAANALNGSTYSVADALGARWGETISWSSSSIAWMNPAGNSDGHYTDGQRTMNEETGVFSALGCSATMIEGDYMTAQECYNKMSASGFDNSVYIVYGHASGILSSGSNHWLVVVGLTDDGFQLLGNASRNATITLSDLSGVTLPFNHLIKVSKK